LAQYVTRDFVSLVIANVLLVQANQHRQLKFGKKREKITEKSGRGGSQVIVSDVTRGRYEPGSGA
jgi:hypothetical protein